MIDTFLRILKKIIPQPIFRAFQLTYHYIIAFVGTVWYRFPSRKLFVIGVTGTKGKTTVVELIGAMLKEAGFAVATSSSLCFSVGAHEERNMHKMTMPGRFFLQRFLRSVVRAGCTHAVIEMTSDGVSQFRHKWIGLDMLVFLNLSPEHIESHGSFEKYRDAKRELVRALKHSPKKKKVVVANKDDSEGSFYLKSDIPEKYSFSLADATPYTLSKHGARITVDSIKISSHLVGTFNVYNILAATTAVKSQGIGIETVKRTLEKFKGVPGRMEYVSSSLKNKFDVIVDYAHTPDSLQKVYETLGSVRKVCVLGATGGGRDKWKRKEFGHIAEKYCEYIVLTNEDPYDENPEKIVSDIHSGFSKSEFQNPNFKIIIDRRQAIRKALELARDGDTVVITGKGTDPYIIGANGKRVPWGDARIVREELQKMQTDR